nr:EOG090X0IJO [Lepidurus arcticus]
MGEQIDKDLPIATTLLSDLKTHTESVRKSVLSLTHKLKNEDLSTSKGLSFLEVKYHLLLSYLIDLNFLMLKKCSGHTIKDDAVINRLVENRTVLERMRPMEHKLKYQVDKLIRTAVAGALPENDPLRFKADPSNLAAQANGDDDSEEGETEDRDADKESKSESKAGVYVPPKLASVPYEGDESTEQKQIRMAEKAKRQALSSSLIQDLWEEHMDTPAEVHEATSNGGRMKQARAAKARKEFEETYFTRLQVTRKDKHAARSRNTMGNLASEITNFGNFAAIDGQSGPKSKSKSTASKRKAGGVKKKGSKTTLNKGR